MIVNRLPMSAGTGIYGVTWDGTSTTRWTRTDDAARFSDPVPYVGGAASYGSPFDNIYPWKEMTVDYINNVGYVVKIPKFWYLLKNNTENNGLTLKISGKPVEGFHVSPAHMARGNETNDRDYVYIGRYHCAGSSQYSVSGQVASSNQTRAQYRSSLNSTVSGGRRSLMDIAMLYTIWFLYLVEFAD